jgi:hypothetical protein
MRFSLTFILCLSTLSSFAFARDDKYTKLSACEKQEHLWSKVVASKHKKLPKLSKLGLIQVMGMASQAVRKKESHHDDISPRWWKKYLHRRGAVAKVSFNPVGENKYTGIFKGATCGLLRMSITYKPEKDKAVAPGLAWKILRDKKHHSANVSALYKLNGQGFNYNIFTHPLSNIVPRGDSFGEKVIHSIFKRVSPYPETLRLVDFGKLDVKGQLEKNSAAPEQLFFVPSEDVKKMFDRTKHDFRDDLLKIPANTVLYRVYALSGKTQKEYDNYRPEDISRYVEESELIGELSTTSEFVASEFGDSGLFFRHEVIKYGGY